MKAMPQHLIGPSRHRVFIFHSDPGTVEKLTAAVHEHNFETPVIGHSGTHLIRAAIAEPVDVLIVGHRLEDLDGSAALLKIAESKILPSIVVAPPDAHRDLEALLMDHVMSFLSEPFEAAAVVPTLHLTLRRFFQMQNLRRELNRLRGSLSELKICFQAKCKLIYALHISEEEAHSRMQRMATDNRIRLVDVAKRILHDRDYVARMELRTQTALPTQ